eukprot:78481_1
MASGVDQSIVHNWLGRAFFDRQQVERSLFGERSFVVTDVPDLSKLRCVSESGMEFEILKSGNNALVTFNPGGAHQVFDLSYDNKEITGGIMEVVTVGSGAASQHVLQQAAYPATTYTIPRGEGLVVVKGVPDMRLLRIETSMPYQLATFPGVTGTDVRLKLDPGINSHTLSMGYAGKSLFAHGYVTVEKRPKLTVGPGPYIFVSPIQDPYALKVSVTGTSRFGKRFDPATKQAIVSLPYLDRPFQVDVQYRGDTLGVFGVTPIHGGAALIQQIEVHNLSCCVRDETSTGEYGQADHAHQTLILPTKYNSATSANLRSASGTTTKNESDGNGAYPVTADGHTAPTLLSTTSDVVKSNAIVSESDVAGTKLNAAGAKSNVIGANAKKAGAGNATAPGAIVHDQTDPAPGSNTAGTELGIAVAEAGSSGTNTENAAATNVDNDTYSISEAAKRVKDVTDKLDALTTKSMEVSSFDAACDLKCDMRRLREEYWSTEDRVGDDKTNFDLMQKMLIARVKARIHVDLSYNTLLRVKDRFRNIFNPRCINEDISELEAIKSSFDAGDNRKAFRQCSAYNERHGRSEMLSFLNLA